MQFLVNIFRKTLLLRSLELSIQAKTEFFGFVQKKPALLQPTQFSCLISPLGSREITPDERGAEWGGGAEGQDQDHGGDHLQPADGERHPQEERAQRGPAADHHQPGMVTIKLEIELASFKKNLN